MITFLKGKKTYIVGILMIILGLIQGDSQMVLSGLGFITLRTGVTAARNQIAAQIASGVQPRG